MDKEGIKELHRLGVVAKCNETLTTALGNDGESMVVIPDGFQLRSIQAHLQRPHRKQFNMVAGDIDSFVYLVTRFRTPETYIKSNGAGGYSAVFNPHSDKPGWNDQVVHFTPGFSDDYMLIKGMMNRWFDQFTLAETIHDFADMFTKPSGGDLRDMIADLRGSHTTAFASAKVIKTGCITVSHSENVELMSKKAPDATTDIPDIITLKAPLFEGGSPVEFSVEVRFKANDGKVHFKLHKPDRELKALEKEEAALYDKSVAKKTECKVIFIKH